MKFSVNTRKHSSWISLLGLPLALGKEENREICIRGLVPYQKKWIRKVSPGAAILFSTNFNGFFPTQTKCKPLLCCFPDCHLARHPAAQHSISYLAFISLCLFHHSLSHTFQLKWQGWLNTSMHINVSQFTDSNKYTDNEELVNIPTVQVSIFDITNCLAAASLLCAATPWGSGVWVAWAPWEYIFLMRHEWGLPKPLPGFWVFEWAPGEYCKMSPSTQGFHLALHQLVAGKRRWRFCHGSQSIDRILSSQKGGCYLWECSAS